MCMILDISENDFIITMTDVKKLKPRYEGKKMSECFEMLESRLNRDVECIRKDVDEMGLKVQCLENLTENVHKSVREIHEETVPHIEEAIQEIFVRDNDLNDSLSILEDKWTTRPLNLRPKMVFSVIGDSDSFVPKPWPKSKFQSALITAAKNAGESLILYRGRNTGISRVVYEAFKKRYRLDFYNDEGKSNVEAPINKGKPNVEASKRKGKSSKVGALNNKGKSNEKGKEPSTPLIQLLGISKETDKTICKEYEDKKEFEATVYEMTYKGMDYTNFMVKLEKKISKIETTFSEVNLDFSKTPLIIVLLEGDDVSIQHVREAIKQNLPVVIVQGTGKAADLIVDCIECDCTCDIEMKLKRRAPLLFGTSFTDKKLKELIACMEDIQERQWLINVFNLNTDDPELLSQITGEAVICGWSMKNIPGLTCKCDHERNKGLTCKCDHERNKGLTCKCDHERNKEKDNNDLPGKVLYTRKINKSDPPAKPENKQKNTQISDGMDQPGNEQKNVGHTVTKTISRKLTRQTSGDKKRRYVLDSKLMSPASLPLNFYFQYQTLQEGGQNNEECRKLLLEALKANRIDYTQVLLDDIDKDKMIQETQLGELYETTVKCESCEFKNECLHMQWILRQENAEKTKKVLGINEDEDTKQTNVFEKKTAMELCREMLGYYRVEKSTDHDNKEEPCSLEDLLLWSIFSNRPRIAEIIWKKIDNQLLAGICCAVLFKHLSEEASDAKEIQLSEELANHSEAFQKRCLMLMDKLYEFDPKTTTKIVKSVSTIWGITSSPIQFAHENKLYDIVAHIGCQKYLNRKWYNKLPPDYLALLKSIGKPKFIKSPIMRYVINYIMFLTMLVSYSSYVMTSIDDDNYQRIIARIWEYYTYLWAFGDLIEEVKRLSGGIFFVGSEKSHRRWYMRLWHYIKDFWNLIDILSYILLIIALFVRHFYQSGKYNIARRLFSLSLLVMYLRFLQIFFISHRLGTQLLMIKEMLKDLVDFLYVMIIIIVGVGIYYHANLFPNHLAIFGPGSFETWSFWKVFYYPYWQIYGETFNEYLEGKDLSDCISNMTIYELDPSQERCPQEEWSVPVVSAVYFLISNLLLVNLVIAKFSYTFDEVQTNSVKLWKYQRYTLVTEYQSRIPSPFNILFYLSPPYWILKYDSVLCCCKSDKEKEKEDEKKRRKRKHRAEIQKVFAGRCIDIEP